MLKISIGLPLNLQRYKQKQISHVQTNKPLLSNKNSQPRTYPSKGEATLLNYPILAFVKPHSSQGREITFAYLTIESYT